jgi:hypothetical protein
MSDTSLIAGYRRLSEREIASINAIKATERAVLELLHQIRDSEDADQRWVTIAKADIQKGFMALVRAVARPEE